MKRLALVLLCTLAAACDKEESKNTESVPASFDAKFQLYSATQTDWPAVDCDWLLFKAIQDAARRRVGEIEKAEGEAGKWYRTQMRDQGCFVNGEDKGSKSSISRDMLLGLALYLWQVGDTENAAQVVAYADANGGKMGEGDPFRTGIRASLYATFYAISKLATDADFPLPPRVEDPNPNSEPSALTGDPLIQTGYEAHLTVVHIYLRGLIYGSVNDLEMRILKGQAERQPRNALFQAVYHRFLDGDQTDAIAGLMDEKLFPNDRLPTSQNYCTAYLFQRDQETDNWEPCGEQLEAEQHTGVDWLFAAAVVRNSFRQR